MWPASMWPASFWPASMWPKGAPLYAPGPISVSEALALSPTVREVPRAETASLSEVGGIVVSVREV